MSSLPARGSPRVLTPRAHTATPTAARRRQTSHLRPSSTSTSTMVNPLSPLPPHHSNQPTPDGEVFHRDHSLISFEWQIQGLDWLRRSLEEVPISGWTVDYEVENPEILPELLRRGVVIGDGWYKLDLARTIPAPCSPKTPLEEIADSITVRSAEPSAPTSLSLYITSPTLESAPLDYAFTSSISIGIRPSSPDVGQSHSYTRWVWHTSLEHEFTKDSEHATVTLPPLEDLLVGPIGADDGFTLCVQLGSPAQLKPGFTVPETFVGPTSMLHALGSLVDSSSGDVQFICLEHDATLSRKRVLYAHSEILRARSDYFKSLLAGGFREVEGGKVVVVDDADYGTVYWMLHFLYCNELRFSPTDDVREVMNRLQMDRREVQRVLSGRHQGWGYRQIPLEGEADEASTSLSLSVSELDIRSEHASVSSSAAVSPPPDKRTPSAMVSTVTSRRLATTRPTPTKAEVPKRPVKTPTSPPVSRGHLPMRLPEPAPDPHTHPSPPPSPASPLAIYMLAHRYRLDVLENLAKERILKGLTIENCMPMLFSTHAYDALHTDILDYVVDYFGSVQLSPEFHVCIKEVSLGVWGETGGDVLVSLFRRL